MADFDLVTAVFNYPPYDVVVTMNFDSSGVPVADNTVELTFETDPDDTATYEDDDDLVQIMYRIITRVAELKTIRARIYEIGTGLVIVSQEEDPGDPDILNIVATWGGLELHYSIPNIDYISWASEMTGVEYYVSNTIREAID